MSLPNADTDIILNKANIALARSQRLVASWLPSEITADQGNVKNDSEVQREEDKIFTAVPETLGLGAPLPTKAADGSWNRTELDSNDKLRKQLLGRNYKKVMAEKARQKTGDTSPVPSAIKNSASKGSVNRQRGAGGADVDDADEDDDEGRAALIGRKMSSRKRKPESDPIPTKQPEDANNELKNEDSEMSSEGKAADLYQRQKSNRRGKATSFLDEILAERSKKRKKR